MDIFLAILRAVVFVVVAYAVVFVAALVNIVFERRALAFMQDRHGPNRTGPHGVLQSVADAFKMMGKEDFRPALADPVLFTLAPIMVMIGAVAVQLVIPYTNGMTATGLDVGLIFIVAITGFTTMAILLGGWSSRNKYSLVGALRAAAQMISYEIPMILGLLIVAMIVGSLRITDVVAAQADYKWIVFYAPFTFLIFYIASIAELNRGPFDLPESESELVSGYGTEYSGMRFGMFFLKSYILVFALVWIRLSLPRLQVDQLMAFAWKILIPLGLLNILATAAVMLWVPHWKWGMAVFSWIAFFAFVGLFDPILKWRLRRQRDRLPLVNA